MGSTKAALQTAGHVHDFQTAPFSFSVDGGAFGPAPTDLPAGVYIVLVEDGATLQSSPITVVIGTPAAVIPGPPSSDSPDEITPCRPFP